MFQKIQHNLNMYCGWKYNITSACIVDGRRNSGVLFINSLKNEGLSTEIIVIIVLAILLALGFLHGAYMLLKKCYKGKGEDTVKGHNTIYKETPKGLEEYL